MQFYSSALGVTVPDLQATSDDDLVAMADDMAQRSAVQQALVSSGKHAATKVGRIGPAQG